MHVKIYLSIYLDLIYLEVGNVLVLDTLVLAVIPIENPGLSSSISNGIILTIKAITYTN